MSKHGNQRAKQRTKLFVLKYLSQTPCVDCGQRDVEVLIFDHVRSEKKDNVVDLVRQGFSIKTISLEIEKTDVVCFNCHMRREQSRRGYSRFGRFGK